MVFFCKLQISFHVFWNIGGNNISEIFPLLLYDLIFSPKSFGILKTFQMFIYIQYLIFKELTLGYMVLELNLIYNIF